jgi:pimeloyl-ACP methyl ester carboxylesterase
MMTERAVVKKGRVETEGDEIYYEVRGQGPPLLLIHGSGMDAGIFPPVADILSDEYTVITYDRRGNSRSTRNDPQNFEIGQQARDAIAVLRAAGETSAFVFGSSAGAVIGLDMARHHPEVVRALVAHEPPVLRALPDSEKWRRFFAGVYRTAFRFGVNVAMIKFALAVGIPIRAYAKIPKDLGSRMANNQDFFVKHEMLPVTNYMPDVETIKRNGVKVVMAVGETTLDKRKYYGRTVPILAGKLGADMLTFPGHHISYLDIPEECAATLRGVLREHRESAPSRNLPAPTAGARAGLEVTG